MSKHTILIPLDGSEFSAQILPRVTQLFSSNDYALMLLRVAPHPMGHTPAPPKVIAPDLGMQGYENEHDIVQAQHPIYASQELDSLTAELKGELQAIVAELNKAGFTTLVTIRFGPPAEEIVRCAADEDADLIAMTTHGRSGGVKRRVFGGVAEAVLRQTPVPVMLLRSVETGGGDSLIAVAEAAAKYIAWPTPVH
jgi:nucleotide-binding universal stress UspA family protein